ncbi:uncharacterized protein LOC123722410 [Papilio machaon]|nr:uncharacterized protein LOC123722410 [Papilio machaon]
MKMAEDLGDNASRMNDEEKVETEVLTLLDLKKRREALLEKKKIILKRINSEKLAQVTDKHYKFYPKSMDSASKSTDESITEHLHQADYSITFGHASLDDEDIAQTDTITFSSNTIFQDKVEINNTKENDANITNIDNLKFIEMIDNSSFNFTDIGNNSVMDISMNEFIPDVSSTNKILLIETSTFFGNPNPQTNVNVIANDIPDVLDSTVTVTASTEISSPQIDEVAAVGDTSMPQPNEVTVIGDASRSQPNEVATAGETSNPQPHDLANTDTYYGDLSINRKRKNKANKEPGKWKKNLNKNLRMKGEPYLGYRRVTTNKNIKKKIHHDVLRPARSMKPSCISSFCKKSKLRSCQNIDEDKRKELFNTFWKTMSWEQRKTFVCCHVIANDKKVTKNPESTRFKTLAYFLTIENIRYQVCKKMFLNTLGIKDWFVRYWLEKTNSAMPPHSQKEIHSKKKQAAHVFAEEFLNSLPKMPSHYCRSSTSRQYLEPLFQNMAQLYKEFSSKCEFESVECLSRRIFDNIFLKLNLSLYHPKKDRCDVCCGHEAGNINDAEIALHRQRKEKARKEKEIDKDLAKEGKCHVFTQDVQSVKLAPNLQASAIYYKTKLCVHNFTMYNLATHEAVCYWFDESNASLEASVFASCIVDQLQSVLNRKLLPVILFSDGCCAQNRNSVLSNALLRLAIEKQVIITQKYLEKGHTQMECDSVHSAIECKLKGREIYLPSQYASIAKSARSYPMPYDCRYLDYNFFTDFSKTLIYKTIRPGKKTNDPTVTDLKLITYKPDGTIWYKLNFEDPQLHLLPQRPLKLSNAVPPLSELPKLYDARLP